MDNRNVSLSHLPLPSETVSRLARLKLETSRDLEERREEAVRALGEQGVRHIEEGVRHIEAACVHHGSTRRESAAQLWARLAAQNRIMTFSQEIDRVLGGGFQLGLIYEVLGPPGSGKTQLCLQLTANCLAIPQRLRGVAGGHAAAVLVDTEYSFCSARFAHIVQETVDHCCGIDPDLRTTLNARDIVDSLQLYRCPTHLELISVLRHLTTVLPRSEVKLLVVDSIAMPFRVKFESQPEKFKLLAVVAQLLMQIAGLGVCVLLTNHVTTKVVQGHLNDTSSYLAPSFGDTWGSTPSVRALLSETSSGGRRFTLIKSLSYPNASVPFHVIPEGIRDAD